MGPHSRHACGRRAQSLAVFSLLITWPAASSVAHGVKTPGVSPKAETAKPTNTIKPADTSRAPAAAPAIDPVAGALLRKMMKAERDAVMQGEVTTVLYRPDGSGAVTSTETVYRNGPHGYRCEYHSPARLNGELFVSNDAFSWHYIPSRHVLRIGSGHTRRMMTPMGPALRALHAGLAQAQVVGQETVAGQPTEIVQITGASPMSTGSIKLWIDIMTGAQLKTEVYDADGKLQSTSYYTSVDYTPTFAPDTFDQPVVRPDTQTIAEHRDNPLNRIPTDAEAGFHVMSPTYVPYGYTFQSASTFRIGQRKAVAMRYADGLTILSLFQSPATRASGPDGSIQRPRTGTVMLTQGNMQFVAIGTVSDDELLKVAQSMK
jgi:outer membrane lipoprotein-sorting protein